MAGVWESWRSPDGDRIDSFSVLTTGPNELVEEIHNRMPVIVKRDDYALWLDGGEQRLEMLQPIMRPYFASDMAMDRVDDIVNSPRNDSAACMQPVAPTPSLFSDWPN
ncbi:hypothetical protein MAIT1_04023 [Magnetofaba australis IT-1]|uniref:Abasic site processing protein n=2 Tax=Magnetofaba TaxID=1472292 RepID=A0A1Y2K740_9PROT|nr:hypothetical protein MAIT1_04023 [Magnetofaba australis IT-1]